ncbi:MAG: GNAT family N-acetyltransferase, partial [Rhodococcus sp. (in: high G+C Gram-positive bacteria)]
YEDRSGYFGYFECVDDEEVSHALLDAAAAWALDRKLTTLVGPLSPSVLWNAGLLVHGNDIPPLVGMPHNPPYYESHVESWGMRSVKEFHSFFHEDPHTLATSPAFERKHSLAMRWKKRSSVVIRTMDRSSFDDDVEKLRLLYNKAFKSFWGFTPVEPDEIQALVATMRPILDPEIVLFAELDGQVVGFVMGIPDVNKAARDAVRSRFGIVRDLHTLWRWRGPGGQARRKHVRLDMMFVDPECPDRGVSAMLIFELFERIHNRGYDSVEAAPVQIDGGWFRSMRSSYPVDPSRTYRIYSRDLAQ